MKRKLLSILTMAGSCSTGIIYASIGVIALLSFFKLKQGGADENSFFVLLNGFLLGRIFNWILILGAFCFIIWRLYVAFKDPYKKGSDTKAILLRTGGAFSSIADAFIAFSALRALFGQHKAPVTGIPTQQRNMVGQILEKEWGQTALLIFGVILLLTALILAFYGLSKRFTETIRESDFTKRSIYIVHGIAYAGYLARGIILGIVGFFIFKAAFEKNSRYVVNTDKAFDFIGDHIGHAAFILVALGTICYGAYMILLGLHYDLEAGKRKT